MRALPGQLGRPAGAGAPARGRVNTLLLAFLRLCGLHELPKDRAACAGKPAHGLSDGATEAAFNHALRQRKLREPGLRVWALGGRLGGSDGFFPMAASAATRAVFIAEVKRYLLAHDATDGIDLTGSTRAATAPPMAWRWVARRTAPTTWPCCANCAPRWTNWAENRAGATGFRWR
ncbi:MAG: hypothetical protein U1E77_13630 [Inhella sp.]